MPAVAVLGAVQRVDADEDGVGRDAAAAAERQEPAHEADRDDGGDGD